MAQQTGPIVCNLERIPAGVRERLVSDFRDVMRKVVEVRRLPDGYALRFAAPEGPGLVSKLGEIIDYDRLCCPFVGHAIEGEPWGGDIWLRLSGTVEAQAFIAAELAWLLPPGVAAQAGLIPSG